MKRLLIIPLVLLAGCARYQPRPLVPADVAARLESRNLDDPGFKAFLEKNLTNPPAVWPVKSWDFDSLTLAAFYFQPSLDVARAHWRIAAGGEITAAQRPNPTMTAEPGYDFSAAGTGLNPWIPLVNFDLPIETAGKPRFRKDQARHLSNAARLDVASAAWLVRNTLRTALIDFTAAGEREKILERELATQEKIIGLLEKRVEAGAAASSETTLMRIAAAKMQLDLADARRESADSRLRVAAAVGLPARALEGLELTYDLSVPREDAAELTSGQARDAALRGRTDILSSLADYAASQSALQIEVARQYPDIHLGPGYQFNNGDHQFFMALTAELPVFNQHQGPIAEAAAQRLAAAARFTELQAKVISDIDRAVAAYRVTGENLKMLQSLADAQKKQADVIAAEQRAGAADQLDLLNSQLELITGELTRLDGRVKAGQAFAALENAVQRPIEAMRPALFEPSRAQAMKASQP